LTTTPPKGIDHIHLLKIDAQGFDFEIIKGAGGMLTGGRVDLVLTEIIFGRLYEGLPQFDSIYAYMADHGYRLTGVYDQHRKARILDWADRPHRHSVNKYAREPPGHPKPPGMP
jgi:Methyltransferase FkbM domain